MLGDEVRNIMRGLYAIVDVGTLAARGLPILAFTEAVLSVRPAALQLRAKMTPDDEVLAMLRALVPICQRAGVPLFANDRPDLARLAGCDGVHVGQKDAAIDEARRIAPGLAVGVSTHTPAQIEAALAARPAYVAFGPVFDTTTKVDPDPVVGLAGLRAAYARASAIRVPLVAIGGITCARAGMLAGSADAAALISELVPPCRRRAQAPLERSSLPSAGGAGGIGREMRESVRGPVAVGHPSAALDEPVRDEIVRRAQLVHELLAPHCAAPPGAGR